MSKKTGVAIRNIRPENIHVMDDVRPFSECVNQMLKIEHDCDYVVYVDADCLILEDMRAFIDQCKAAYVDTYVSDRFRGRIHCGIHITRIDVVRKMVGVEVPKDDIKYVLRPESRIRNLAMKPLRLTKQFRNFDVLHDHFQYYRHIFFKYALRELRSRTKQGPKRLTLTMKNWPVNNGGMNDYTVAKMAIDYARAQVPADSPPEQVHTFIEELHDRAVEDTFNELAFGQYDLTVLKNHDGVTDITVAHYYAQLDDTYPRSKFILTVRDKGAWLRSCQNHWYNRSAFREPESVEDGFHLKMRRLLRAAVYGCYKFVPERFSWVYDQHVDNVLRYFADRPEDLLVLDICGGDSWIPLCEFLGRDIPNEPFPHKGSILTKRMEAARRARSA